MREKDGIGTEKAVFKITFFDVKKTGNGNKLNEVNNMGNSMTKTLH